MKFKGVVVAAFLMGAAVLFGQVATPTGGSGGIWGWMSGVVRPKGDNTPTGTGFYRKTFSEGGTNWLCYVWTNGVGTWKVSGTVTGDLLVVAGGGDGGYNGPGGGGGAGELYYKTETSFVAGTYAVVVGDKNRWGEPNTTSMFGSVVCLSGGRGGNGGGGESGGSGGGGSGGENNGGFALNTVGVGNIGGAGGYPATAAGGGGGAGGAGVAGDGGSGAGGNGGVGMLVAIDGSNRWYAAGGGGGGSSTAGSGGSIGAGAGGRNGAGVSALPNTGSGGGGACVDECGQGGSGVVIVRIRR